MPSSSDTPPAAPKRYVVHEESCQALCQKSLNRDYGGVIPATIGCLLGHASHACACDGARLLPLVDCRMELQAVDAKLAAVTQERDESNRMLLEANESINGAFTLAQKEREDREKAERKMQELIDAHTKSECYRAVHADLAEARALLVYLEDAEGWHWGPEPNKKVEDFLARTEPEGE